MSFQDYAESDQSRFSVGRKRAVAIVGIVVVLLAICIAVTVSLCSVEGGFEVARADAAEEESQASDSSQDVSTVQICVDVAGCVNAPQICYLKEGSRVADAIAAAGGFTDNAATSSINQARVLVDGEQLYVPSTEEVTSAQGAGSAGVASSAAGVVGADSGKVNINTADVSQLQTISGIGESKAKKIIAYRDANGPFASVDDLVNVSGIGEKTLESIRESICI